MKKSILLLAVCAAALSTVLFLERPTIAEDAPHRVEVTASRFAFAPAEITLKKGQPVILVLKSTDVTHGLKFSELSLNVKVDKGATAEMKFTPDKTGDFVGRCSVFCGSGHGSMALTLHVVE
jgi:cytochrome c oxidase subunit 2